METRLNTISICPQCETIVDVDLLEAELGECCCHLCKSPIPMSGPVSDLNDQTLRLLINKAQKPLLVDFYAGWCAPCNEYLPLFSRFASEHIDEYIFAKISVEFNPVMAQSYNVKGIPHTLLFVDGQERKRKVGVLDYNALESTFTELKK